MTSIPFMPILFMVLLLALLVYALVRGPVAPRGNGPKSSLARDGGQGGNWYLLPANERVAVLEQRKASNKS